MSTSTKASHTPGPWSVDVANREIGTGRRWLYAIEQAHSDLSPQTTIEHDANARLIAAAPEMLEALEGIAKKAAWLSHEAELQGHDLESADANEIVHLASAAISKAKKWW